MPGRRCRGLLPGALIAAVYDVVYVLDLDMREVRDLGLAIGGSSRFGTVAASEGWAFWFAGPDRRIGRLANGRDGEQVPITLEAHALLAHGGCAFFAEQMSVHRWCPDDLAPVEIATDELIGDVAADDEAVYYIGAGGLVRFDRMSGERLELGVEVPLQAQLADDGERLVWWHEDELFAVDKDGGAPVRVGSLVAAGTCTGCPAMPTAREFPCAAPVRRGKRRPEGAPGRPREWGPGARSRVGEVVDKASDGT